MTAWQPLQPQQEPLLPRDPAWEALAAALRAVAPQVQAVATPHLTAPSWRPGETAEHAAYAEGGKAVWRLLLALSQEPQA
jgi:hypothetical protein